MAEALAQTIGYVNRARAFMPPGTVGPFIMRFDAGTVPVGYLVFSSESRSLGEIQDLALNRVRPQFATLPGLTSPPPFGGSQRTIVIRVDPDRLRSYGMSPDEVIRAVTAGNVIMPSGSVNIGDETRISPMNSVVSNINDLLELPIRTGAGPPVSIRDIGSVSDSTDIPTAYALVNGRRAVYIPVTKRPDASTLSVVSEVKANLGRFQALVPDDIKVSYELDQSRNVSASLQAVLREAAIGALLDRTDGAALPARLAERRHRRRDDSVRAARRGDRVVGRGPDHQRHDARRPGAGGRHSGRRSDRRDREHPHAPARAACRSPAACWTRAAKWWCPRLLAMLSVVAVFVPSFFMTGVSRSLFVPLSLAVGFSMIASFLLSSSLVPVLSVWLLGEASRRRGRPACTQDWVDRLRDRLGAVAPASGSGALAARRPSTPRSPSASSWRVGLTPRTRDLPRRRRQPVPAAVPRAGRDEVRIDRAAGDRRARRDQAGRRSEQRRDHARVMSASSPRRIRSTRSFCGPAVRTKACCRWRSGRKRGIRLTDFEETLRRRFSERISHRAVLVRARRHRQPDHELRHVDAGRGRDHGTGFRRQPDVRGEGSGRARRGFPRSAICSTARRSTTRRSRST